MVPLPPPKSLAVAGEPHTVAADSAVTGMIVSISPPKEGVSVSPTNKWVDQPKPKGFSSFDLSPVRTLKIFETLRNFIGVTVLRAFMDAGKY